MNPNSNKSPINPSVPLPAQKPPARTAERKPTVKEAYAQAGTSEAQVSKDLNDYLSKVTISDSDRMNGSRTIINDPVKCLKACVDIVKRLEAKKGSLYDDDEFGPTPSDPHGQNSIMYDNPFMGAPTPEDVSWIRPQEICKGMKPEFLVSGAQSNDVCQGGIGDCWLIGAMSVLATQDKYVVGQFNPKIENMKEVSDQDALGMMQGVYPPMFHSFRKYGLYVLRFYKNFMWRYIIMDDKLPCYTSSGQPELIFASCATPNEFWVPLIEKAYAKLHGCYQALISGDLSDGLTDFTGLVSEKLAIQDKGRLNTKQLKDADTFWEKLRTYKKNGALMGCSIIGTGIEHSVILDGEDTGLVSGHAYSI